MSKSCAFAIIQHEPSNKYRSGFNIIMSSVLGRIAQIKSLLGRAEATLDGSDIDVKIAVCPEHYLSKKHGFYKTEDIPPKIYSHDLFHEISDVIPVLKSLKNLSDKYNGWLIIPGTITIIGLQKIQGKFIQKHHLVRGINRHATDPISEFARDSNNLLEQYKQRRLLALQGLEEQEVRPFYNLSPIYYNGKIVMIRRKKFEALASKTESLERLGPQKESIYFPVANNSSILTHEGLRIGVEICSEHEYGSLAGEAQTSGLLDIHIVISNEVYPFIEHSPIKESGLLVHAGSKFTGVYHKNEIPTAEESVEFDYQRNKQPGMYLILDDAGD